VVTTEHDYEIGVAEPIADIAMTSWSAYAPWSVPAYAKCRVSLGTSYFRTWIATEFSCQ